MPSGQVKFYDSERGFGFLASEDGEDVFVHASALPPGVDSLTPGSKVEFGIVDGKKGKQALSVEVIERAPSVTKASRRPADEMAPLVEDLIKLLDSISDGLGQGRYPDDNKARTIAKLLRATADNLDV